MSGVSLPSRGRSLDVGQVGFDKDQLPPLDDGPIDLGRWFNPSGKQPRLELEIGSGKGTFLVEQAQRRPTVSFIGLEYARAYWRYAADRCRRRGLENVRLVRIEAGAFVRHYVPVASLSCVHIYFPDPWPKKRHHKRRLIQASFLRELAIKLEPSGLVQIVTDHSEYFQWIEHHAQAVTDRYETVPFEPISSDGATPADERELVGTNFERKYLAERRSIHALALRRRVVPGDV